ncbi:sucrase ferredoxin [Streptomyces thermolineatus]|uniref:sucrase ferredoxin n=1 Tax=Streptomyces thermolineatus TaxID=44033 RepID=UPI00384B4323
MITCATASRELDEPLTATAATARTWLLVEQPGPWGAKALTSGHLDPALGRELEASAKGTGTRIALVRRPGRHADRHGPARHHVFLAHTAPGNSWIRHAVLDDPAGLRGLDPAAAGRGDHGGWGEPWTGDPLVCVCTNGKRDRCCALLGRPLAGDLAHLDDAEVWEITHIGGHRFAPTVLVLPHGYAYGRVDARHVKEVVEGVREGRVVTGLCRGRSTWDRPGQAAELAVRALTGEDRADALTAEPAAGAAPHRTVLVRHTDGRRWRVAVEQGSSVPPRPESCGADPASPARFTARDVHPLPPV